MWAILTKFFGALIDSIVGGFVADQEKRRAEDAQRQVGQLQQKTVDQDATLTAHQRAEAEAAAVREDSSKRIGDGTL